MGWEIQTTYIDDWLLQVDPVTYGYILKSLTVLRDVGPGLGRPLVDSVHGSRFKNMKELRPTSPGKSEIRILFAFDPNRKAILLIAGDKRNQWERWYRENIPIADARFELHLKKLLGEY